MSSLKVAPQTKNDLDLLRVPNIRYAAFHVLKLVQQNAKGKILQSDTDCVVPAITARAVAGAVMAGTTQSVS
ncbi:hypothetical protein OMF39_20195, partial [Bordetella pertussis]